MSDKELIEEAAQAAQFARANRYGQANHVDLIQRLADALEAATSESAAALAEIESRIEDRDYWHGVATTAKDRRDAAEALVRRQQRYIEELESVDGVGLRAERDAALEAIERVRAIHARDMVLRDYCSECSDFGSDQFPPGQMVEWPCPTVAALDGAPEPEWEYGFHFLDDDGSIYKTRGGWDTPEKAQALGDEWIVDERESHMLNDQPDIHVALIRRRPAGQWLPVEGESK